MPAAKIYYSKLWECSYRWFNGGWVPTTVHAILTAVEAEGWDDWGRIRLSQGGLSKSVTASAGTHDGLGSGDIAIDGRSKAKVWRLCARLIRSGLIAFPRGYVADSFQRSKHIHFVSWERLKSLSWSAQLQLISKVYGYLHTVAGKRGAGLGGRPRMRYTGPGTHPDHWAGSPYNASNIQKIAPTTYVVTAKTGLLGLDVNRTPRKAPGGKKPLVRPHGYKITVVKLVKRWGRWNGVTRFGTYYSMDYLTAKEKNPR